MSAPEAKCLGCGAGLGAGAIEGFCQSCLATVAFRADPEIDEGSGPESRLLGRYELGQELGRGGMGIVYRARQLGLNRSVAVKVLRQGPYADARDLAQFRREAEAAAALRHPNIVAVYEVGSEDGHAFFSMELVEGPTLAQVVERQRIEPVQAARYAEAIAGAITAAHAHGILHRDLKPSNVIIDQDGQPRVTDFGLAKQLDGNEATLTEHVVGSPGYIPPEQIDPQFGRVSVASDVYGLGALLYHLLTGRPPFGTGSVAGTLSQVLNTDAISPRSLNPAVPADLETICLKCLQKQPSRRYATAADLAADLRAFLERRPIRARPVSIFERAVLWSCRHPALAVLSGALLLAILAGIGGVFWQWRKNQLNLYAADLRVAADAVRSGDLGLAREVLGVHRPADGQGDFAWRYLNAQSAGNPRVVLGEHPWIVNTVACSPNGQWVASGSVGSGTITDDVRLWDLKSSPPVGGILGTPGAREIGWLPDSARLVAVHTDGQVRIWDIVNRRILKVLPGWSMQLASNGSQLITCEGDPFPWQANGTNGPVILHDLISGASRPIGDARGIALSHDAQLIVFTDLRTSMQLREIASGRVIRTFDLEGPIWSLTFSPDSRQLVAAGFDADLRVWRLDAADSHPVRVPGHSLHTWRVSFSPDGRRAVSTASDRTLRLWDTERWEPTAVLRGHGSEVWCAAFTPDGNQLVSGGKDRAVMLWSATPPAAESVLEARTFDRCFFSSDRRQLVTVTANEPRQTLVHSLFKAPATPAESKEQFNLPPSQTLNTGSPIALNSAAGQLLHHLGGFKLGWLELKSGHTYRSFELQHEPQDSPPELWTASLDGAIVAGATPERLAVWETKTAQRLQTMVFTNLHAWSLTLSPDSRLAGGHGWRARVLALLNSIRCGPPFGRALRPGEIRRFLAGQPSIGDRQRGWHHPIVGCAHRSRDSHSQRSPHRSFWGDVFSGRFDSRLLRGRAGDPTLAPTYSARSRGGSNSRCGQMGRLRWPVSSFGGGINGTRRSPAASGLRLRLRARLSANAPAAKCPIARVRPKDQSRTVRFYPGVNFVGPARMRTPFGWSDDTAALRQLPRFPKLKCLLSHLATHFL